jgi:RNA polymerase sigma-70 factor, ECF subfamily
MHISRIWRYPVERFLIERALRGDHQAFARLLKPYERVIFVSAMALLNNESDAEDASQQAILNAFGALGQFHRPAQFSIWLVRIVINEAKLRLQKDRREPSESLDNGPEQQDEEYVPTDLGDWRRIPISALENRELRETLNAALKSLPGEYRVVMALRDIAHLNGRETADVLGLTEYKVKARLGRARLQIRDVLAARLSSVK